VKNIKKYVLAVVLGLVVWGSNVQAQFFLVKGNSIRLILLDESNFASSKDRTDFINYIKESVGTVIDDGGLIIEAPFDTVDELQEAAYARKWTSSMSLYDWDTIFVSPVKEGESKLRWQVLAEEAQKQSETKAADARACAEKIKKATEDEARERAGMALEDKAPKNTAQSQGKTDVVSPVWYKRTPARYVGANVAIAFASLVAQAAIDGYADAVVAKDLSSSKVVARKLVGALKAVGSLKKHRENIAAFGRVFVPGKQKDMLNQRFLARCGQFARNKKALTLGLVGMTAVNAYGLYQHGGEMKARAINAYESFKGAKKA